MSWFEEPVSSDDLDGLRLLRDRAPAGMDIAAGEYGYDLPYFRRMLEAGAVDVLQADATRCAGITGFLRVGALCEARSLPLSAHCAPSLHVHPACACRTSATWSISTTTTGSSTCSSTARRRRSAVRCGPTCPAPAWASNSNARTPPATPSDSTETSTKGSRTMAIATALTTSQRHRKEVAGPLFIDASALEAELRRAIRGEVRFDAGSRALYATDGSNYRQVPIGVVIPRDIEDVVETVAVCRRHGAPLLREAAAPASPAAAATSPSSSTGRSTSTRSSRSTPAAKLARVQPGTVLDVLRTQAEKHHLTFAPDPSTHTHNTLGGMIGNNSCGVHSLMGLGTGRTSDQVHELDILLYDGTRMTVGATTEEELERIIREGGRKGEIYARLKDLRDRYADEIRRRYPKNLPRRVSGYNLDDLLPEKGFHVARALVGHGGDVRHHPGGEPAPGPQPGREVGPGARLSRRLQRRRPRHARSWSSSPPAWRGWTTSSSPT